MSPRVTSDRLIGRDEELAVLEEAFAEAESGRPALAFVCGDSGLGKTRLVNELASRARTRGARVLSGDCVELGDGELPYAPIIGALRPLVRAGAQVLEELPQAERVELARLLPGLAAPAPSADERDDSAQGRLFEALLTLLDTIGGAAPVVLIVEDLHWADTSTRSFLAFLARSLCRERVLVVGTYRGDELHRRHPLRPLLAQLERDAAVRRIVLEPLTRDEVAEALEAMLGQPARVDLVTRLYTRTDGNPLYIEELLATGPDGRGALPGSLRDALMLRIERLDEPTQELLRLLAVGQRLDHELLDDAIGLEATTLRGALRAAVADNVIVATDEGRYTFRHALLREVVDDDLLPGERAELHGRLAHALERRAAEQGTTAERLTAIAHHFLAAGDRPHAFGASLRAALASEEIHAYGEAAALLERALELWDHVPESDRPTDCDRIDLLARAGEAHYLGGDRARDETLLRAALEQIDEAAEPLRAGRLLERLALAQQGLNRGKEALDTARRGLALVGDEPTTERAALLSFVAAARMLQGRYTDTVTEAREAIEIARSAGDEVSEVRAMDALGVALTHTGQVDEGDRLLREAIALGLKAGHAHRAGTAALNLADALHQVGRTDEARAFALGWFDRPQPRHTREWIDLLLSEMAFAQGDWAEAARRTRSLERRAVGTELLNGELRRAELALGRGEHEEARTRLESAQELAACSTEPQYLGPVGALLAELRRREGNLDGARQAVDEALDRLEFCTEDAAQVIRVAAAGVTVEADRAQRARDLGDAAEARAALAHMRALLARARSGAPAGRPVEAAWRADAEADATRARGKSDPRKWAKAAAAWANVGRPYPAATARWREAEAHLGRDDRAAATAAAQAALETAHRLGARWLAGEVEGLAARARLRLEGADVATAASDGAGAPGAETEDPFGLTARERQVLSLVARGATNREIGDALYMAEKTASVHVSRILAKLDVRTRTQAAAVAHRLHLTETETT